jgi:SagB-type dehydrogenase family enzyme
MHEGEPYNFQPNPEPLCWEVFHENSKTSRYDAAKSDQFVADTMSRMHEALIYQEAQSISLPSPSMLKNTELFEAMRNRTTARPISFGSTDIQDLADLLYYSYGVTRVSEGDGFSHRFRVVPSAGSLYPLELYVFTQTVNNVEPGLYHYNPLLCALETVAQENYSEKLGCCLVQKELASASILFAITGLFSRNTFKYGDRGYRFTLIEAGHVCQNMNLVCTALGLTCVNIGGFFDRDVDRLLRLDGVNHSTVYMLAVGGKPL